VTDTTKSLLIVEDNEVTRAGMAAVLRGHGYYTRQVASGREAIESLCEQKPDLILLDMLLAGNGDDGWRLLGLIQYHADWRSIPVIIVTGLGVACEEWAVALGARTFVRKPIDTDDLLGKIQDHCGALRD
jgi:twitching motility two-component system response regulator PilH